MKNSRILIIAWLLFGIGIILSLAIYKLDQYKPALTAASSTVTQPSESHAYQRIICMIPSVTESVFALGCGDRVVGVTDFCRYPEAATQKTNVGGFFNPDYERMFKLQPDLIITLGRSEKITNFCQRHSINVLHVEMDSLAKIYIDWIRIGEALGCVDRAVELCHDTQISLQILQARTAQQKKKRVFYCMNRATGDLSNLHTIGRSSQFINELIAIAGGENIFTDLAPGSTRISKETLLQRQPEVIIEPHPDEKIGDAERAKFITEWQRLNSLPAVRDGKVYFPTEDFFMIPGPRLVETAALMARMIHPEDTDE
jgi:cobalamin transport system substrate-binding protein